MGVANWFKIINLKMKLRKGSISAAFDLAHLYLSDESLSNYEEEGIKYLTLAAQKNVIEAQCELAEYYFSGKHVTQDTEKALQWYLTAADGGLKPAWNSLMRAMEGIDPKIAFNWCEEAAGRNSRHANVLLGSYYCSGISGVVQISFNKAARAFDKAKECGINEEELPVQHIANMANYFFKEREYVKAFYWSTIGAKSGSPLAKYILGRCYYGANGTKGDYKRAFGCFEEAAKEGISGGKVYLGLCYLQGLGTPLPNLERALKLLYEVSDVHPEVFNYLGQYYMADDDTQNAAVHYEKAYEAGIAAETDGEFFKLALYYDGIKNYERAAHWLKLSSKGNTPEGKFLLAQYYFYGRHFEKDESGALKMLQQLCDVGYQPAMHMLYKIYDKGEGGVPKDKVKAFDILRKLAESGYANAIRMMGDAYMEPGNALVDQDYLQAAVWYDKWYDHKQRSGSINREYLEEIGRYFLKAKEYRTVYRWFLRAAESGSSIAHHILGKCYFEGTGVSKDLKKAFGYFKKAAENGILESKVYLGRFFIQGFDVVLRDPETALKLFDEVSSGYPEVFNYIGQYYLEIGDGKNAAINYDKADAAGIATETGQEFYDLALYFDGIQDYERAVYWLNLSSKKDKSKGLYLLAQYYFYGRYFKKDQERALEMLHRLCDDGYKHAMHKLYSIYDNGEEGVPQNKEKAFRILLQLAQAGNEEAIKMMGDAFMEPDNPFVGQDYARAAGWYEKWYECKRRHGNVKPEYLIEIGRYYQINKDFKTATDWFLRGIDEGAYVGYFNLGRIAEEYEKNSSRAFQYYAEAANRDVPEGMAYLGLCYCNGVGTNVDYSAGYKYFEMAAERKNPFGQYAQAFCLMNELGVETKKEDAGKVFTLLSQAVAGGNANAYELLSNCYDLGIGTEASLDRAIYYMFKGSVDQSLLDMVEIRDYYNAYEYVRDKKDYFYFKMILTYFGKGTQQNIAEACEMFVDYYRSDTLRNICSNNAVRPVTKYRIARDVIEAGARFERDSNYEKAVEYYKAALRFNPKAGIFLARVLFEQQQCDALPLLQIMSEWRDKDGVYRKCRSIANNMLGLYYEYFYSRVTNPQTPYTDGYTFKTTLNQNIDLMMKYYKKSAEDEAYKRII